MKQLLLSAAACLIAISGSSQLIEIVSEVYAEHDGIEIPALDGLTTYRVYAVLTNELDEISAVYGDVSSPLSLTSVDGFFQSDFGASTGWSINPAFFAFSAEAEFDSWITLGVSNSTEVTGQPNSVGIDDAVNVFETGGDFVVNSANGGSWFTLFGDTQAQAGPDFKVLLAQLTTSGSFTGSFNVQVFLNGEQSSSTLYEGIPFSSSAGAIFGCMDPEATNYNPDATEAGETCLFPCALTLTLDEVIGNSCPGVSDGMIIVSATGGQLGVTFGIGENDPTLAVGTFNGLVGGVYTVNAMDGAGCIASVDVEMAVPEAITLTASLTESVSCAGDNDAVISGEAAGGAGDYTFSLTPNFSETASDLYFDGLAAGLYTVYAQDANGCTAQSIAISVANPQQLSVTVAGGQSNILDATCADSEDGQIVVLTLGGAGTQQSMEFSTDGVNYAPGNVLYVLGGTYTIYAMDVNGCIGASTVEYTVGAPDPIVIDASVTDILCFGDQNGMVSFNADGGNGGLTFSFNEGESSDVTLFGDLLPGDYVILATDVEDCQAEVVATVGDATELIASASSEDVTCFGDTNGSVEISGAGGTNLYEYSADGTDFGSSPIYIDLTPGIYSYYVQDSNGCQASVEATINEPDELTVTGAITNDTGAGDGALDIDVAGGNGGNMFAWSGPDAFTSADEDLTGIVAGEYTVTITDMNGCSVEGTFGVPVGIDELGFLSSLSVSPNPSNGAFQLEWAGAQGQDLDVSIFDGQGRMVTSQVFVNQTGSNRVTMDLTGVANGVYQLQVRAGLMINQLQLLKQ
tara:strand:+ start:1108 stop:3513 length:2406 start_codon:yes stop_codon:yes gene_type:complete